MFSLFLFFNNYADELLCKYRSNIEIFIMYGALQVIRYDLKYEKYLLHRLL